MDLQWFVISVLLGFEAAWMSLAVLNNIRHAEHKRASVIAVMQMTWLAEDVPESFEAFQHRRCLTDTVPRRFFKGVVVVECTAGVLLWGAAIAAFSVAFGALSAEAVLPLVLVGALSFCLPWAGFLIGGEWFVYFATPRSPQYTHFFLLLWGLLTLTAIAALTHG